jgi:hypothetical protein
MVRDFKISAILRILDLLTKDIVNYFNHFKVYLSLLLTTAPFLGYERRGIEAIR